MNMLYTFVVCAWQANCLAILCPKRLDPTITKREDMSDTKQS